MLTMTMMFMILILTILMVMIEVMTTRTTQPAQFSKLSKYFERGKSAMKMMIVTMVINIQDDTRPPYSIVAMPDIGLLQSSGLEFTLCGNQCLHVAMWHVAVSAKHNPSPISTIESYPWKNWVILISVNCRIFIACTICQNYFNRWRSSFFSFWLRRLNIMILRITIICVIKDPC